MTRMDDAAFEALAKNVESLRNRLGIGEQRRLLDSILTEARRAREGERTKDVLLVRARDWIDDPEDDQWGDDLYLSIVEVVGERAPFAALSATVKGEGNG
jgi:hypothetical protein